jgi:hypothetical protein
LPNKQATIITSPNKLSNRSLKRSLSPAGAPRDTRLRCARALIPLTIPDRAYYFRRDSLPDQCGRDSASAST